MTLRIPPRIRQLASFVDNLFWGLVALMLACVPGSITASLWYVWMVDDEPAAGVAGLLTPLCLWWFVSGICKAYEFTTRAAQSFKEEKQ